jgi:hypothetical protein
MATIGTAGSDDTATSDTDAASIVLNHAKINITQFVDEVLASSPADIANAHVQSVQRQDNDRVTFGVVFRHAAGHEATVEVTMPGLPLEQVNYGARDEDKAWRFPRLRIDRARVWWKFAVDLTVQWATADESKAVAGPMYACLSAQRSECGLGFGYDDGLPDNPFTAAWGCRAIVHQSGSVDVLPDRQSACGDDEAIDALITNLNDGLNGKWKDVVSQLLRNQEMLTSHGEDFTLLDEGGVVVVANTKGSYGYLYVCAYTTGPA